MKISPKDMCAVTKSTFMICRFYSSQIPVMRQGLDIAIKIIQEVRSLSRPWA